MRPRMSEVAEMRSTASVAGSIPGLCLLAASWLAAPPAAQAATPAAVFDLELDRTGPQAEADDATRLQRLDVELRALLAEQGYAAVDLAPIAAEARRSTLRTCDGCDVPLAARLGARISVTGWVQKVSDLILNVNLVVRDVPSGKVLHAGSVDIRGNTDTSWSRGLRYLMQRLYPSQPAS